ncbi:DUF418 domain-containing protein [Flavobacterium amniphilum]|uniref:DUF418 domain-containing protein n=1 Tax=Flavobacterium amniphilum TaxID=1834035 RepID=UPI002029D2AB|nr:DUF418 domain-containing protein [Flavobacterium amniphilum]MCL9804427.1 DUF418 domain-containing protein [Flavobacterium amniphilum]
MQTEQRVEIIDVLRGWALLVVVISNYLYFGYSPEGKINGESVVSEIIQAVERFCFSAKGWTLLFVLFGFGFGVIYAKMQQNAYAFLTRRMLVLFGFALFNTLIYDGDILRDYAFLGLLFLCFIHLPARKLILIGGVLLLLEPFLQAGIDKIDASYITAQVNEITLLKFSHHWLDIFKYNVMSSYYYEVLSLPYSVTAHYVMFICMLFGLALQKSNFFDNLTMQQPLLKRMVIGSFLLTLLLWGIAFALRFMQIGYQKYFPLHYWIVIATMVFTASGIVLLFSQGKMQDVFKAFSSVGKMTFTNYIAQNIISFLAFQGAGLRIFHYIPFHFYFMFAIMVYCFQIAISYWWLQTHTYGPLEWLWRQLSATGKKTAQLIPERIFVEK